MEEEQPQPEPNSIHGDDGDFGENLSPTSWCQNLQILIEVVVEPTRLKKYARKIGS